ncbi:hypothetical protein [Dickeya solani]|uniref:Uncharacterized protein n=1 Tax=Dickeya solani D s0432-1 TaxID=1231725 RepID=A0AAV3KCY3_9GAMM|nr:hypothetical protein [Dickeya solani]ANE77215.1 hypothetical protein A4U42_18835 [Dickeya solani IPO 2222]AUC40468.1 hypothetical protein D083_0118 [Dickeya solani RNS 08.23.3.1.A]AUH07374.1 hypothetical protein BJD21_02205 [Dickeya solani D s0432-1]AUH11416.1 hypothetical protein BJJ98_02165 [Dickeya solani]AYQ47793.1 hypothetical protein CTB91_01985 [Dickeya solani]
MVDRLTPYKLAPLADDAVVSNYVKNISNYVMTNNPNAEGYSALNKSGILLQTHETKRFGHNAISAGKAIGTILIISNQLMSGLATMKAWAKTLSDAATSDAVRFQNVEWLIHLHLNSPLMNDWAITTGAANLIKELEAQGKGTVKIRFAIDCSAWLMNREHRKLDDAVAPADADLSKVKGKLSLRESRLKTIPYGLLRAFGLHKAMLLNNRPQNAADEARDLYLIVDVEPGEALVPYLDTPDKEIGSNRARCFLATWNMLNSGRKVVYNRLQWLPHYAGTMAAEWYNMKYPDGAPMDSVNGKDIRIIKSNETKLKVELAVKTCMDKLTAFLNTAGVTSPYPSEPLLGFSIKDYASPQVITAMAGTTAKSKVGAEREFMLGGKAVAYVEVCNVMGIGSGEGQSLTENVLGKNNVADNAGTRIWTSSWGVLKDIVASKLRLERVESGGTVSYEVKAKITVQDLKDMGGVYVGTDPGTTVIVDF